MTHETTAASTPLSERRHASPLLPLREVSAMMPPLRCFRCGRSPDEIGEYVEQARVESEDGEAITAAEWCWEEEGTLDRTTGRFACTECYIAIGMPTDPRGWIAPTVDDQVLVWCPPGERNDGVELCVDTTAYGVPGVNWCPFDHTSAGSASVYPYKVRIPGRGIGQYRASEIIDIRRRAS